MIGNVAGGGRRKGRPYVMAMVLGTALSALGGATTEARANISPATIDSVSRYCTACWRNANLPADRWGDCTQEVLSRLLTRVRPTDWNVLLARDGEQRRELVRAIDAVKKQVRRDQRRTVPLHGVTTDYRDSERRALAEVRQCADEAAGRLLSDRQQKILAMSFDGCTVPDIGRTLALPVERVSDEKYKAVRKLREHFMAVERLTSSSNQRPLA